MAQTFARPRGRPARAAAPEERNPCLNQWSRSAHVPLTYRSARRSVQQAFHAVPVDRTHRACIQAFCRTDLPPVQPASRVFPEVRKTPIADAFSADPNLCAFPLPACPSLLLPLFIVQCPLRSFCRPRSLPLPRSPRFRRPMSRPARGFSSMQPAIRCSPPAIRTNARNRRR